MKAGMNLLLWTTHVTEDHYPLLSKLKAAGFAGVEIPVFEGEEKHYAKLGAELRRQGLAATAVTVMGAAANPISPEAPIRQAAKDHLKWALGNCKALGAELLCGPLHSALGVFSGAGPTADEKKWSVEVLRAASVEAEQAGVTLAVEFLNRFECYFLTTAAQTKEFVQAVNHPRCRLMYDTFHANLEEKGLADAIRGLGADLVHVHISENDRGTPGTGHVDWPTTFKTLKAMNYQGWLTIEAFGRSMPALAAATKVWRDLFPSPEEVYTHGLRFMNEMWAKA